MRHGSIRWYAERIDDSPFRLLDAFGLRLVHPEDGRARVLSDDGQLALTEADLSARLRDPSVPTSFVLWLGPTASTLVSLRRIADGRVAEFDLDGLDPHQQQLVCAAVLWAGAQHTTTRLIVAGSYLEDCAEEWDRHEAGRPWPAFDPEFVLERQEQAGFLLTVGSIVTSP